LCGPDHSGIVSINAALQFLKASANYDACFYSVSDAIIVNPKRFDKSIARFMSIPTCDFMYVNAEPGLVLPREKFDKSWYNEMPFFRNVHFNVCCAKSKYIRAYNDKMFVDVFEGASVEPFVGYMCYAQGGYRRVCPFLKYEHIAGQIYTDRKNVYKGKGKVKARGGSWTAPSVFIKRDLKSILEQGSNVGAYYQPEPFTKYPLKTGHTEKELKLMHDHLLDNMFLKKDELDYSKMEISVI